MKLLNTWTSQKTYATIKSRQVEAPRHTTASIAGRDSTNATHDAHILFLKIHTMNQNFARVFALMLFISAALPVSLHAETATTTNNGVAISDAGSSTTTSQIATSTGLSTVTVETTSTSTATSTATSTEEVYVAARWYDVGSTSTGSAAEEVVAAAPSLRFEKEATASLATINNVKHTYLPGNYGSWYMQCIFPTSVNWSTVTVSQTSGPTATIFHKPGYPIFYFTVPQNVVNTDERISFVCSGKTYKNVLVQSMTMDANMYAHPMVVQRPNSSFGNVSNTTRTGGLWSPIVRITSSGIDMYIGGGGKGDTIGVIHGNSITDLSTKAITPLTFTNAPAWAKTGSMRPIGVDVVNEKLTLWIASGSAYGYAVTEDGTNWTISENPMGTVAGKVTRIVSYNGMYYIYSLNGDTVSVTKSADGITPGTTQPISLNLRGATLSGVNGFTVKPMRVNGEEVLLAVVGGWTRWGAGTMYLISRDGTSFTATTRAYAVTTQFGWNLKVSDIIVQNGKMSLCGSYDYTGISGRVVCSSVRTPEVRVFDTLENLGNPAFNGGINIPNYLE